MSEDALPPRGGDGRARSAPTRAQLRERYGDKLRWLVLVTLMIGTMSSIVSSTKPSIQPVTCPCPRKGGLILKFESNDRNDSSVRVK